MKLKQVLIEGGVVYGNPEMEYPKPTRDNCKRWKDNDGLCDGECYFTNSGLKTCYHEEVKKWNSGRLPFEDQDKVKEVLRVDKIIDAFENGKLQKLIDGKFDKHKDGLYSVDLDVTVVEQYRNVLFDDSPWHDYDPVKNGPKDEPEDFEYRKVLRIN